MVLPILGTLGFSLCKSAGELFEIHLRGFSITDNVNTSAYCNPETDRSGVERGRQMTNSGRCCCGDREFQFEDNFRFTKGDPKIFARREIEKPRMRYLYENCGMHTRVKSFPRSSVLVLKVVH